MMFQNPYLSGMSYHKNQEVITELDIPVTGLPSFDPLVRDGVSSTKLCPSFFRLGATQPTYRLLGSCELQCLVDQYVQG